MNKPLKILSIIIGVAAVGLIIYALLPGSETGQTLGQPTDQQPEITPPTPKTSAPKSVTPTTPKTPANSGNSLTVTEHQQPGTAISISSLTLSNPGYIAIYESASDAKGNLSLGAFLKTSSLLPAGKSSNIRIPLATSPSGKYLVTLRIDNGNKIFSPPEDPLAKNAAGAILMAPVTADAAIITSTKTVYVEAKELTFIPNTITVNRGDSINFRNADNSNHTVTASAFGGSHMLPIGGNYTLDTTSLAPGTYNYHCDYHSPMKGTVIVK